MSPISGKLIWVESEGSPISIQAGSTAQAISGRGRRRSGGVHKGPRTRTPGVGKVHRGWSFPSDLPRGRRVALLRLPGLAGTRRRCSLERMFDPDDLSMIQRAGPSTIIMMLASRRCPAWPAEAERGAPTHPARPSLAPPCRDNSPAGRLPSPVGSRPGCTRSAASGSCRRSLPSPFSR